MGILADLLLRRWRRYGESTNLPDRMVTRVRGGTFTDNPTAGLTDFSVLPTYDVRNYGSVGDGVANDAPAIQAAVTAVTATGGGIVYLPTGSYFCSAGVTVDTVVPIRIMGEGRSTRVLWGFDGNLFNWSVAMNGCSVGSMVVVPSVAMTAGHWAINATNSCSASEFPSLWIAGTVYGGAPNSCRGGVRLAGTLNTVDISNLIIGGLDGTDGIGIEFGSGSNVQCRGGRIMGGGMSSAGTVGIDLTGGLLGLRVDGTDISSHAICMRSRDAGAGNNGHVFISGARLAAGYYGLSVQDAASIDLAGTMFYANETYALFSTGAAKVAMTGGSVISGGALGGSGHGINPATMSSLALNGVIIQGNAGIGIIGSSSCARLSINGCHIVDNDTALDFTSDPTLWTIVGNVIDANTNPSTYTPGAGKVWDHNVGSG